MRRVAIIRGWRYVAYSAEEFRLNGRNSKVPREEVRDQNGRIKGAESERLEGV